MYFPLFLQTKWEMCNTYNINTTRQLNVPSDLAIDTKRGRISVSDSFWVDKIAMFEIICEFCINPSHEGNMKNYYIYLGRIYAKVINNVQPANIRTQLQENDQVYTLFDFCINPFREHSVKVRYYEGFMQNMLGIMSNWWHVLHN